MGRDSLGGVYWGYCISEGLGFRSKTCVFILWAVSDSKKTSST